VINVKKSISWAGLYGFVALVFLLTVYYGNRAVTVISQSMPVTRKHTIVLDAGHGGEDGGAVGVLNGKEIYEKDLNLSIALLLRDLLEADGINVIMTREEDVLLYDQP
jgi:N-acetylmuramoyl-L-alanine amidase